jgi:hypothetical protein
MFFDSNHYYCFCLILLHTNTVKELSSYTDGARPQVHHYVAGNPVSGTSLHMYGTSQIDSFLT